MREGRCGRKRNENFIRFEGGRILKTYDKEEGPYEKRVLKMDRQRNRKSTVGFMLEKSVRKELVVVSFKEMS